MDTLAALPAEVVLRILNFASIGSIANLTCASQSWHQFIDSTHQDVIYFAQTPGATSLPNPEQHFESLNLFTKCDEGVQSWKEACRRRVLLERSWSDETPKPRESIIQVGRHPVWRFRPDFKRRIILSTCHAGGMNVTDMDSGNPLWSLSKDDVRRFAHLEYQDGTAVWDRFGNALEVWKTDLPGLERGQFQQVAIIPHDVITRGFQLSYNTLCVVSTEGEAFVYDFPPHPAKPKLRTHVEIEEGAIGHLDQSEDAVMYSIGTNGYHLHDKNSGELLGHIHPHMVNTSEIYHIKHPSRSEMDPDHFGWLPDSYRSPRNRAKRLSHLQVKKGPLSSALQNEMGFTSTSLVTDEWGAGMLNGKTMVGVSRGGRMVLCSDWRRALRSQEDFCSVTSVIECDASGDSFDLGGWLHIHETVSGKRIIFEIKDSVYILSLDAGGRFDIAKPAFTATTSSAPELAVPVSFMGIYDDCIMSTFTTLGEDPVDAGRTDDDLFENEGRLRHFPTKAIRALSFAPNVRP